MSASRPPTVICLSKGEVTSFLRNMYAFNTSTLQELAPILEERQGIDLRLHFILHLINGGTVHPSAIAQAMRLPNSLVTKHLDQLSQRNLLARTIDAQDSRRIRLALTDAGVRVMHAADTLVEEVVGKRLACISDEKRRVFLDALHELAEESNSQ